MISSLAISWRTLASAILPVCSALGMEPKEIVQFDEPEVLLMFKDRKPIASIMQGKEFAIYFEDGTKVGASELKKIKAEWKRISKENQ